MAIKFGKKFEPNKGRRNLNLLDTGGEISHKRQEMDERYTYLDIYEVELAVGYTNSIT